MTIREHLAAIAAREKALDASLATINTGNRVRCESCGVEITVNAAKCFRTGWPECCGETMTLQRSPQEGQRTT